MMSKIMNVVAGAASALALTGGDFGENFAGPKAGDKIAIIGAGPSGIHMAHLLKKSGVAFDDIRVFERSRRIGGKAKPFKDRASVPEGVDIDAGAIYMLSDDVYEEFHNVLNYVGMEDELVNAETPYVGDSLVGDDLMSFQTWVGKRAVASLGEDERAAYFAQYADFCNNYIPGDACVFTSFLDITETSPYYPFFVQFTAMAVGVTTEAYKLKLQGLFAGDARYAEYGYPTYNEFTAPILAASAGAFVSAPLSAEFQGGVAAAAQAQYGYPLQLQTLNMMRPLMESYITTQGYGLIDVTPLYYTTVWISPKFIGLVQSRFAGVPLPANKDIAVVRSGVGSVFEALADIDDITIHAAEKVETIKKREDGRWVIKSLRRRNIKTDEKLVVPKRKSYVADFVISAIDQRVFRRLLKNKGRTAVVRAALNDAVSCQEHSVFRVSDVNVQWPSTDAGSRLIFNKEPLNEGLFGIPSGVKDVTGVVGIFNQVAIKSETQPTDLSSVDAVFYDLNPSRDVQSDASEVGISVNEVYDEKYERYFSRSRDFEACNPWNVLSIQGGDNVWYVGGSVSFESIENVLDYNRMIVDQWTATLA